MKTRLYAVYDRKALVYQVPFASLTDGAAVRMLSDAVADSNTMLSRHPNDYVLFYVGDFDDSKGALEAASPIVHVIDAASLVKALQSEIPFPDGLTHVVQPNGQAQVED